MPNNMHIRVEEMKLLQCVSILLCLYFVKSRGVKPNILKTSGDQENKYVLNTGENETFDHDKEIEITSNKSDDAYKVKNSLEKNNELYNRKNNFGIRNPNNNNRLVDKIIMNARKQNSKAKTDKKRKDNGKVILNNLNSSRRYNIHIDPILDSLLLDKGGHVTHFYYDRSVERLLEDDNYYDGYRPYLPYYDVTSNVDRGKKKRIEERKKRLEKEREQQKPRKKKTENEHQRQTKYSKKGKKTSHIYDSESYKGSGKSGIKISNFLENPTGTLLGHLTINGKTFNLDDIKNKNVILEF